MERGKNGEKEGEKDGKKDGAGKKDGEKDGKKDGEKDGKIERKIEKWRGKKERKDGKGEGKSDGKVKEEVGEMEDKTMAAAEKFTPTETAAIASSLSLPQPTPCVLLFLPSHLPSFRHVSCLDIPSSVSRNNVYLIIVNSQPTQLGKWLSVKQTFLSPVDGSKCCVKVSAKYQ